MSRKVAQKDMFGCGIACLASVMNTAYKEVLGKQRNKAMTTGFLCKDLIYLLEQRGFHYSYNYINTRMRKKIYEDGTIVFIKRSTKYPSGHYLCRVKNVWMDPWVNFTLSDDLSNAKAGFRKKLPSKPIYVLMKK